MHGKGNAAISGHKTLREIARYTNAADQKRLGEAAMMKNKEQKGIIRLENCKPGLENNIASP
jgi:hypothetical protein